MHVVFRTLLAACTLSSVAVLAGCERDVVPVVPQGPTPIGDDPGVIYTVAGNGFFGFIEGAVSTESPLYYPVDMYPSDDGFLYVSDWNNHRIRKIAPQTRAMTTIVNLQGALGDGRQGPALDQPLNHPTMLQTKDGKVWFAAWHNHRIKVIDQSGMLTTYAGSSDLFGGFQGDNLKGTRAQFNLPSSFAWDDSTTNGVWTPNMFISDQGNFRVRRVNPDTVVTTYAGGFDFTGFDGDGQDALSARFSAPRGPDAVPCFRLDVDRANRKLYIADSHNNRVRMIDLRTRIITTFAGKGPVYPSVPGYLGDGGPATDAEINFPTDVAVGPDGMVYICDSYNNAIRRVNPTSGVITTVAGTGVRGYSGDGGPATQAQLSHPNGIYVSSDNRLYIADTENNRIRRVRL